MKKPSAKITNYMLKIFICFLLVANIAHSQTNTGNIAGRDSLFEKVSIDELMEIKKYNSQQECIIEMNEQNRKYQIEFSAIRVVCIVK